MSASNGSSPSGGTSRSTSRSRDRSRSTHTLASRSPSASATVSQPSTSIPSGHRRAARDSITAHPNLPIAIPIPSSRARERRWRCKAEIEAETEVEADIETSDAAPWCALRATSAPRPQPQFQIRPTTRIIFDKQQGLLGYGCTSGESCAPAYLHSRTGRNKVADIDILACRHIGAQFAGFEREGEFGFGGGHASLYSYPYRRVLVVGEGE